MMKNFLVSGIGGPTPKGVARSLKLAYPKAKIVGIDANPFAAGLYVSEPYDKTYIVPNAVDDTESYWSTVEGIIKKEQIDFAFIVPETEVLQWSLRKSKIGLPCKTLVQDYEIASFLFDKKAVSDVLVDYKLSPKTVVVNSENLNGVHEILGYPYWIRYNKTAGALGSLKIDSDRDLKNWLSINSQKDNFIASPYLPGRNYACKLLYRSNQLMLAAVAERIEYLMPNSSPSRITGMCARGKLLNRKDIFEAGVKALEIIYERFGFSIDGMFTIDFKEDKDGIPLITEINIRHVSFTKAFSLGGANFAQKTIESYQELDPSEGFFEFDSELNFIRAVDNELFVVEDKEVLDKINKDYF